MVISNDKYKFGLKGYAGAEWDINGVGHFFINLARMYEWTE